MNCFARRGRDCDDERSPAPPSGGVVWNQIGLDLCWGEVRINAMRRVCPLGEQIELNRTGVGAHSEADCSAFLQVIPRLLTHHGLRDCLSIALYKKLQNAGVNASSYSMNCNFDEVGLHRSASVFPMSCSGIRGYTPFPGTPQSSLHLGNAAYVGWGPLVEFQLP